MSPTFYFLFLPLYQGMRPLDAQLPRSRSITWIFGPDTPPNDPTPTSEVHPGVGLSLRDCWVWGTCLWSGGYAGAGVVNYTCDYGEAEAVRGVRPGAAPVPVWPLGSQSHVCLCLELQHFNHVNSTAHPRDNWPCILLSCLLSRVSLFSDYHLKQSIV